MKKKTFIILILTVLALIFLSGCSLPGKGGSVVNSKYSTREIWVNDGERRIYGVAYIPNEDEKHPLVIYSHELGNNHTSGIPYAEKLAENGYACYTFDFCGGSGDENKSDGDTHEMSVITEKKDLEAVIREAKTWDFTDSERIYLLGGSQGALVSALVADEMKEDIKGLVMMYPAFNIEDEIHSMFKSKNEIPDEIELMGGWIMVGRNYAGDIWDMDFYHELEKLDLDVLLLHGNSDTTVDISYSDRASKVLKNCEYHVLENAGHEFDGKDFDEAVNYILAYLHKH